LEPEKGIRCTSCGSGTVRVLDSRPIVGKKRKRRYVCMDCMETTWTVEMSVDTLQKLVKAAKLMG